LERKKWGEGGIRTQAAYTLPLRYAHFGDLERK
jgi:hypothetical protein